MPRIGITAYDLLISCPGDVLRYAEVVKECVDIFNHTLGKNNNVQIMPKHWSIDSFPQSGDKPQELLNKQFVRDCDAAVAIFWTKFGTPTDKYQSGTEEEIEEILSSGKQVFLYFVDAQINPSEMDLEQFKKVKEFKERYKDRGIYCIVKNEEDFRRQFYNHLTMYFLSIIMGELNKNTELPSPLLQIQDYSSGNNTMFLLEHFDLLNSKFVADKYQTIFSQIEKLNSNCLPKRNSIKTEEEKNKNIMGMSVTLNKVIDVDISEQWKKTIIEFSRQNSIKISDNFWNIGNLKRQTPFYLSSYRDTESSFQGTNDEKQRYKDIQKLYWNIIELNEYVEYFSQINTQKFVRLVIANIGTTFDEDIEVKLIVQKDSILTTDDIPVPKINIIKDILEMKFLDFFYGIDGTETVYKYNFNDVQVSFDYQFPSLFSQTSIEEEYENQKREYKTCIEHIFDYKKYKNDTHDILVFHIPYLKHNTKIAFPSSLVVKNDLKIIEYEITSKHVSNVIKGKITLVDTEK